MYGVHYGLVMVRAASNVCQIVAKIETILFVCIIYIVWLMKGRRHSATTKQNERKKKLVNFAKHNAAAGGVSARVRFHDCA